MFQIREAYTPVIVGSQPIGLMRVGYESSVRVGTIKAPTGPVNREELLAYINALDPFVESMDQDADVVDKDLEASLSDPAADMKLFHKRDNFVKTWDGWVGEGMGGSTDKPGPGYYSAWQEMKNHIRSGDGAYTKLWPWLIFGPLATIALVPVVVASAGTSAASVRGEQWNNIRDAHIRLGTIRDELVDVGYKPRGGPLLDVPGDVGALGIGLLGDEGGKGKAGHWYENIPWGWLVVGLVLVGGAAFLGQVRGLLPAPAR